MARIARLHHPHTLVHIIARFVNYEFRITDEEERVDYLRRLARTLDKTDWCLLAWAIMSTHLHLAAIAGLMPSRALIHPIHSGFGPWLNERQGRLGPLFAGRHETIWLSADHAFDLIAYIHNNPVRGGVVQHPDESSWTSHRYFLGHKRAPQWLAVGRALEACGFSTSAPDRKAFGVAVDARRHDPRNEILSGGYSGRVRRELRSHLVGPISFGAPEVNAENAIVPIVMRPGTTVAPVPTDMDAGMVLSCASEASGISVARIVSRQRTPRVTDARRLALLVWIHLGEPMVEMARLLGISVAAATQLLSRYPEKVRALEPVAESIAARIYSDALVSVKRGSAG